MRVHYPFVFGTLRAQFSFRTGKSEKTINTPRFFFAHFESREPKRISPISLQTCNWVIWFTYNERLAAFFVRPNRTKCKSKHLDAVSVHYRRPDRRRRAITSRARNKAHYPAAIAIRRVYLQSTHDDFLDSPTNNHLSARLPKLDCGTCWRYYTLRSRSMNARATLSWIAHLSYKNVSERKENRCW